MQCCVPGLYELTRLRQICDECHGFILFSFLYTYFVVGDEFRTYCDSEDESIYTLGWWWEK